MTENNNRKMISDYLRYYYVLNIFCGTIAIAKQVLLLINDLWTISTLLLPVLVAVTGIDFYRNLKCYDPKFVQNIIDRNDEGGRKNAAYSVFSAVPLMAVVGNAIVYLPILREQSNPALYNVSVCFSVIICVIAAVVIINLEVWIYREQIEES